MSQSLALQKALFDILTGLGLSVFDSVPPTAEFPYVSFGPSEEYEADADCIEAVSVNQQLDIWSRATGSVEAKTIAATIRNALHRKELPVPGGAFVEIEVANVRYFRDHDGLTTHAVISLSSL